MKKVKTDAIINAVGRHLCKRNYTDSEVLKKNKLRLGQSSEQFEKYQRLGHHKVIALQQCTITEHDANIQYSKLKSWIDSLDQASAGEIHNILFPVFISLYNKLNNLGHSAAARSFYSRHQSNFMKIPEFRTMAERMCSDSNNHLKFTLEVSQETFEIFSEYLASSDHLILLHLLNTTIEVITEIKLDQTPSFQQSLAQPKLDDAGLSNSEEVQDLTSAISRMNKLAPSAPLFKMFAIDTGQRRATCASIATASGFLSCGFQDSSLAIWNIRKNASMIREPTSSVLDLTCSVVRHHPRINPLETSLTASVNSDSAIFLHGHSGPVYDCRFTPPYISSPYLLTSGDDTTIRLWSTDSIENVTVYRGHTYPVWTTDISPTGQFFVSGSQDRTAKLWTFERTYPLRILAGHHSDIDCVAFHPNGIYVASGSADRSVRMWSITDGNTVRILVGHWGTVLAVAFSPCGKYLASAGEDRRVKVWDVTTSSPVHDYSGHSDVIHGLVWISDSLLASCSVDGNIRVWNTQQPHSAPAGGTSPNAPSSTSDEFANYAIPAQWKSTCLTRGQRGSVICIAASD